MSDQKRNGPPPIFKFRMEYTAPLAVAFFFVLFSMWTLGVHFATFVDVPWIYFYGISKYFLFVTPWIAYIIAATFARNYASRVIDQSSHFVAPKPSVLIFLMISILAIFIANIYIHKFIIVSFGVVVICFLSIARDNGSHAGTAAANSPGNSAKDLFLLFVIIVFALSVVLFVNRPDLDDSSFIQIASQTLAHPDRAPLSFDASLGIILDNFRFAPYRISSYETLVAFVTELSGLNIYTVYYTFLPSIAAILTILTAFIFLRWFFPTNRLALAATGIFLVIMLAWGETHIAYGNRVFVRLFQGKCLIIALTTPFAVLVGLMLVNRPSCFAALMLAIANICAIGVSSSGLVMTVFNSVIIGVIAVSRSFRRTAYSYALIAGAMSYPVALAFWLKYQSESAILLNEVGTYLPINASLGMGMRESISLCGLLLGYALYISSRNKYFVLLMVAFLLFIINPWFSDFTAFVTSRNMSWRLAWAAPIPLMLSIALVAGLTVEARSGSFVGRATNAVIKLTSFFLLLIFLFSNRWALSTENNLTWGLPTPKLEKEFYVTKEISDRIRSLNVNGLILAHHKVAAWLPLNLPEARLVMPGHTYPIQLQAILPSSEYALRMCLYNSINGTILNVSEFAKALRALDVELIIVPSGSGSVLDPLITSSGLDGVQIEKLSEIADYSLYRIMWIHVQ